MTTEPGPRRQRQPPPTTIRSVLGAMSLLVLAIWPAVGCGPAGAGGEAEGEREAMLVFAAASLTEVMVDLGQAFEDQHPGLAVELNLAGSAALRSQVLAGAPADVIATANTAVMDDLVAAGAVAAEPAIFATNHLTIAVAEGNPGRIDRLADFARPEPYLGLCAAGVPCGDLADEILERAGVVADVDTRELDVRALLAKIEAGELDAGLVYATDIATSGQVEEVVLPPAATEETAYPVAVLADAPNPSAGHQFVEFLLSAKGRAILADAGFGAPGGQPDPEPGR